MNDAYLVESKYKIDTITSCILYRFNFASRVESYNKEICVHLD